MRPITLSNATKVLIAAFAVILSFTDFAQARDRFDGGGHFIRRHHRDRQNREVISGINVDSRLLHRRNRNVRLSGINADRRYFERRYGYNRRPNRQFVVREYRGRDRNYWESAYGGHFIRRHHRDRQNREVISGINVDSRLLHRRNRNVRLSGINADRRYFEPRYGYNRRPNRQFVVREYSGRDRNYWESAYGGDNFPSDANDGTYFGGLSAWTDPGNGTYFQSERGGYGYYSGDTDGDYRAPRPRIIRVTPSSADSACSWEASVCVIRR